MVYYITSPVFQQTICSTLKEEECLIGQGMVESHFLLNKYVKGNLTKFSIDMDVFLIDLSALDDSDEDILSALKTIRTIYEDTRIIIFAATRIPGDQLLANIFALGIVNIIATSDYWALKQELKICLGEKGKSFKDALVFKDVKDNIEIVGKERLKIVNRVLIGIVGSEPRIGVTHNAIILAGYLKKIGFLVALVERNQSGDFERIRIGHGEKLFSEEYFTIYGVDYYPAVNKEKIKEILDKNYNFIICDYGYIEQAEEAEFLKCHEKLILAGSKTWELHYLNKILKEYPIEILQQFHFCFNLIHDDYKKQLQQAMKYPDGQLMEINFLGYNPEPFNMGCFPAAEKILEDYLLQPVKQQKKGFFARLRRGK